MAVCFGDGIEICLRWASHRRNAGSLSQGQGGPLEPPQAERLARALEGRVEQPGSDVRLWRRLFRPSSRAPVTCYWAFDHIIPDIRRREGGPHHTFTVYLIDWSGAFHTRAAELLSWVYRAGDL